jgi:cytochrome c oxidase subunit 1
VIAVFAGVYYWFPKYTGRLMNETLGKIHFWGTAIPFNCIFIPLFYLGMAGDHRRIYNYLHFPDSSLLYMQHMRQFATISLVIMLCFQVVFFFNLFTSIWTGKKVGNNPWDANTLEWQAPSPPPHGNFAQLPNCYRGPYEYSVPGRSQDFWPQNEPAKS